jgi:hypothetical protein
MYLFAGYEQVVSEHDHAVAVGMRLKQKVDSAYV